MSALPQILEQLRSVDLERALRLRPPYPPLSIQVEQESLSLIRLKPQRRAKPLLEAVESVELEEACIPASIFEPRAPSIADLGDKMRGLFERSGTRPGRVAVVVPDNQAKIALITLPERPASRRQLDELVRAQMRRAVPFKLEDARLSYQVMTGGGRGISILVALVRRTLVEPFERLLEQAGARVGLFDLSTPNLINLCRVEMEKCSEKGGDAALLNCDKSFFTLAILRQGQLIFFRCKTYPSSTLGNGGPNGTLIREVANSLAYYREKLEGEGVGTIFVRTAATEPEEITRQLNELGQEDVRLVNPAREVVFGPGVRLDATTAQQLAPAIGAALGRGR